MMKTPSSLQLIEEHILEGLDTIGRWYRHQSGLEIVHLANNDQDRLFSFCFPSFPHDNTGVAHIIEHSLLCGSQRYPLKDPFVSLLRSSMSTFLNAFTFPDKTCYLASSTIEADFYNLFRVYADAVFSPLLKEEAFWQEGWHASLDQKGHLDFSGIVFNEMRGAYAQGDAFVSDQSLRSLYEKSCYRFDSGGCPKDIVDLDYVSFKTFYENHYQPASCRLFLYGDIPLEKVLELLEDPYLRHQIDPKIRIDPQALVFEEPWSEGKRMTYPLPLSENPSMTLNFLLPFLKDGQEALGMELLSSILLSESSSLITDLLTSGIGEDISPASGLENDLYQSCWTIGLRASSSKTEQLEDFYQLVFKNLQKIATGIDKELFEGQLFSLRYALEKERSPGFSISMMRRCLRSWMYGDSPFNFLHLGHDLDMIRQAGPHFIEELAQRCLFNNPHYSLCHFIPSPDYSRLFEKPLEDRRLHDQSALHEEKIQKLHEENQRLNAWQNELDDPYCLPRLHLSEIPSALPKSFKLERNGAIWLAHTQNSACSSLYLGFKLDHLEEDDHFYLALLMHVWPSIDLKDLSYLQVDKKIRLSIGELHWRISYEEDLLGNVLPYAWFGFSTLNPSMDEAWLLLVQILQTVRFDKQERLRQLIFEDKNDFFAQMSSRGDQFARLYAEAHFRPSARLQDRYRGIESFTFWKKKWVQIDQELPSLSLKLAELSQKILHAPDFVALLASHDEDILHSFCEKISLWRTDDMKHLVPALGKKFTPYPLLKQAQLFTFPLDVHFNAITVKAPHYKDPLWAASSFIAHYLRSHLLWKSVRMKGGAYGASASLSFSGTLTLSSYRDPHVEKSFLAFEDALKRLADEEIKRQELDEACLGLLADYWMPQRELSQVFASLHRQMKGISDTLRQSHYQRILELKPADIQKAAQIIWNHWQAGKKQSSSLISPQVILEDPTKFQRHILLESKEKFLTVDPSSPKLNR